jgi:hypothetical protein
VAPSSERKLTTWSALGDDFPLSQFEMVACVMPISLASAL